MNGKTLQIHLFQRITQLLDGNTIKMAKEVATLLNISSNVIYDRINAKKLLNIEELHLMSRHFKINIDDLISPHVTGFQLGSIQKQPDSFDDFLLRILTDLRKLAHIKDCEIIYVANETPFSYYLFHPNLILFKMYVWGRTVWEMKDLQSQKFNAERLNHSETTLLIDELSELYITFPTTEFWNINMLDTTINQIRHCLECDLFENPSDALLIIEEVEMMVAQMEETAKSNKKNKLGASMIHHNELIQNSTIILVNSDKLKAVYFIYDSPNFMISYSDLTFKHTFNYYEKIKSSSFNLNEERQRIRFFKALRQKVKLVKEEFGLLVKKP
jgi:hypothetical protein